MPGREEALESPAACPHLHISQVKAVGNYKVQQHHSWGRLQRWTGAEKGPSISLLTQSLAVSSANSSQLVLMWSSLRVEVEVGRFSFVQLKALFWLKFSACLGWPSGQRSAFLNSAGTLMLVPWSRTVHALPRYMWIFNFAVTGSVCILASHWISITGLEISMYNV